MPILIVLGQILGPIVAQELPVVIAALEAELNKILAQHGYKVNITPQ